MKIMHASAHDMQVKIGIISSLNHSVNFVKVKKNIECMNESFQEYTNYVKGMYIYFHLYNAIVNNNENCCMVLQDKPKQEFRNKCQKLLLH